MKPAPMITLFARPQSTPRGGSAAYTASVLAHVAGCVWLFFGLSRTPHIDTRSTLQRFTVRVLDTPLTEPQMQPPSAGAAPSLAPAAHTAAAAGGDSPAAMPPPAPPLSQLVHQSQVLVQPDAPPDVVLLHKTPIPTVFLWSPSSAPIKPVIEAPQQKSMVDQLRPRPDPPNRELNLADVRMSATPFSSALHALPPSTTSPIIVRGPDPVKQMPQTATQPAPAPAPVRVMSITDLQAQGGPVAIPLANASTRPSASQSISSGHSDNSTLAGRAGSADSGHANQTGKPPGAGPGQAQGPPAQNPAGSAQLGSAQLGSSQAGSSQAGSGQGPAAPAAKPPASSVSVAQGGPAPVPGPAADSGSNLSSLGPVTRITLPKDGQFGVVVVGSSLADQYPETVGIWNGRPVYTVYLHVGAGKSWILQYSLAPSAAAADNGARPDAPWPYDIVRPHFDPDDFNSDALMVHGFVTTSGRFERLALVFPEDFAKAKFLLSALQQWEFRPARVNGQIAPVEVLLIIPEETE